MALFFTQLLNGIQNGAVYASLAIALVLIFRTTGILNFAQGEMALYSTYLVWKLHRRRALPVWIAILVTMAISFVGGALIERVVIRPVEQSSPLVIVIVTIGMFLAINSLTQLQFGSGQHSAAALLPAPHLAARQRADLVRHARARRRARGRVRGCCTCCSSARSSVSRSAASRATPSRAGCSASRSGAC